MPEELAWVLDAPEPGFARVERAPSSEIAERVYLAEGRVKNYVSSILGKLGAPDRTAAALKARDLGIL